MFLAFSGPPPMNPNETLSWIVYFGYLHSSHRNLEDAKRYEAVSWVGKLYDGRGLGLIWRRS